MLPVPWQMKIAALAGGALIVLLVAACSSGGNNTTTATQTATQTSPTISGGGTSSVTQTAQVTATQAGATPAAAVDPCTLLTKDEIAAAVSEAVGDGVEATNQAAPTFACEWASANAQTAVYVTLYAGVNAQAAAANFNTLAGSSTDVGGIGDKAHWTSQIETLEALKGPNDVSIQVVDFKEGANPQTEATTLAQEAVARLP
jgi:hypothetical protein